MINNDEYNELLTTLMSWMDYQPQTITEIVEQLTAMLEIMTAMHNYANLERYLIGVQLANVLDRQIHQEASRN